jgi:hypothetical protein
LYGRKYTVRKSSPGIELLEHVRTRTSSILAEKKFKFNPSGENYSIYANETPTNFSKRAIMTIWLKKKKLAEPKEPMVDPNYIVPTAIGEF